MLAKLWEQQEKARKEKEEADAAAEKARIEQEEADAAAEAAAAQ